MNRYNDTMQVTKTITKETKMLKTTFIIAGFLFLATMALIENLL